MSVRFLQSLTPQEEQSIRVNDVVVRGHQSVAEYLNVTGNVGCISGLSVGTAITHKNIPVANITQLTSISTAIDASAVANPYNFNVTMFTATTVAGGTDRFFLNMPTGVLNSLGFASISAYYYSGVVGTAGIPVLSIVTQEQNRVTILLKNEDSANALNGVIHFRFKYELGSNSA